MSRGSIANRYLQNLEGGGSTLSQNRTASRIFSSGPLRENKNILNSRTPSLSPQKSKFRVQSYIQEATEEEDIDDSNVTGLRGRMKLAKKDEDESLNNTWFDNKRQSLQGYEYLCRVGEAKRWIEKCIGEELPSEAELCSDGFRDGVVLAKLTRRFVPELVRKIVPPAKKLQFIHTENINNFFTFLDIVNIPESFRFELTDLYDKKNIPKVIFCLHALSHLLAQDEKAPEMTELVGKLEFTDEEISASQKALNGANLPNFSSMKNGTDSSIPQGKTIDTNYQNDYEEDDYYQRNTRKNSRNVKKSTPRYVEPVIEESIIEEEEEEEEEKEEPEPSYEELDLVLQSVIKFQSLARGSIFRYQMFVQKMVLKANADDIIELQSIYRGSKFRNGPFIKDMSIRNSEPSMIEFQAIIRGGMTRKILRHTVKKIYKKNINHIVSLQSVIRGQLLRESLLINLEDILENNDKLVILQAVIRRVLYKNQFDNSLKQAFKANSSLTDLQSIIRGVLARKQLLRQLKTLDYTSSTITKLQSVIRSKIARNSFKNKLFNIEKMDDLMVEFQSKIRAVLYQRQQAHLFKALNKFKNSIIELQSIARGGNGRMELNLVLDTLDICEFKITKLTAKIRGDKLRDNFQDFKSRLLIDGHKSIVLVQSAVRGLLSRFEQENLLDELEENQDSIVEIQSIIRGNLKRKYDKERDAYFLANIDKIIKIQSFIKGKDFTDAYKKLLTMKNPPISVISKFAHLLNDTDKDFQDEIYLNRLNAKILNKTKETEILEKTNKELDIKIALLVKNKITLDELIRQRNNGYQGYKVEMDPNIGVVDINSFNKNTRLRIEVFQKMFYLLQTEPKYFTEISTKYDKASNNKDFITSILKTFNYGGAGISYSNNQRSMSPERRSASPSRKQQSESLEFKREEYLFVRFLNHLINYNIESSETIEDFATSFIENSSAIWQKLFNAFIRTNKQKNVLKSLFGPLISSISDIDNLSLESNPLKIYQTLLEESNQPPDSITVEEAIKKPNVRNQFIKNLAHFREISNSFFELIWEKIDSIPFFIRSMMSCMVMNLKNKFQDLVDDKLILSISGYILIDLYLNSIIIHPENYGITLTTLNSRTTLKLKNNLIKTAKFLSQMALMNPFPIEEVYLQPLNDYIESQSGLVEKIFKKLSWKTNANVDQLYNMSVMNDLSLYKKPSLLVEIDDLGKMSKLIGDNRELFSNENEEEQDIIIKLINELNVLAKESKKSLKYLIGAKELKLTLDPVIKDMAKEYNGSKKNALIIQAKRCVIYMLQVQSGKNLLDLLLSKIKESDEVKFKQIIIDETKEKANKNIYTNASQGSLGDLTKMSYHNLKFLALEKILELESMGFLSRDNNFQQLINEIAHDIKAKKDQRFNKQEQIKSAENILKGIEEKEKRLTKVLDVYNDYISKAMASLQSQPGQTKKKLFPFFSKQYFYQRELRRQGKTPKFGSYKYSAKYLSDQGILAELKGIKCGIVGLDLPKVDFMFSCDEVGIFLIEAASGSVPIPDAIAKLSLDDLLLCQYENRDWVEIYDGVVRFHTETFLNFIFKKFYDNSSNI